MWTLGGGCVRTHSMAVADLHRTTKSEIRNRSSNPKNIAIRLEKLDLSLQSIPERHLSLHTGSKNAFRSKDPVRNLIFSTRGG